MAREGSKLKSTPVKSHRTWFSSKSIIFALPLVFTAAVLFNPMRLPPQIQQYLWPTPPQETPIQALTLLEQCKSHRYTTEIVSLDPLVIYINNFTSPREAAELINAGEADFRQSFVSTKGKNQPSPGRTSESAPLDEDLPLVQCILNRARTFMGSMLQPYEPFSIPQLVRYHPSQRYDLHTDFWLSPRVMDDGSGRMFNRVASFFVFLKANCTGGETHFPFVDVLEKDKKRGGRLDLVFGEKVRAHEQGGVAFKPLVGSAIFWVNLDEKGRGDGRVRHAGLPVEEGEKVGMNIWPRKFYY